jgi:SulP family sulfate permease
MEAVAAHWNTLDVTATLLAATSLLGIVVLRGVSSRIPGTVLALLAATALAWSLGLRVETIESRFGGIPSGLPALQIPQFRPELIRTLLAPAITVAMLGAIESLLSAVVSDRMSGDKHNPNVELIAQGVANVISPLAGGLPATGAIARTATNIRSGARTPAAGMIHAVTLLLIVLFAAPLAKHIPLAVLAAILMIVAYNMGEWGEVPQILRLGKSSIAVWLVTFALTVLADLTVAVEAGMILAVLLFIRQVTQTTSVTRITKQDVDEGRKHSLQLHEIPEGAAVFRIHGPFLFGSTDKLSVISENLESLPHVVILRLRNMTAIDATGLHALEELADKLHGSGREVILCGMRSQPRQLMSQAEFERHIGRENICRNVQQALGRARKLLAGPQHASA